VAGARVLISTIPAAVGARFADTFATIPVLLDAVYDRGPLRWPPRWPPPAAG